MSITIEKALHYFENEFDLHEIQSIKEIGDKYIFTGGKPGVVYYGMQPILIDKTNGDVTFMNFPDDLPMLGKAIEIDIPKNKRMGGEITCESK